MTKNLLVTAASVAACGFFVLVLSGQQAPAPAVFTAAQAETGRTAALTKCGRCHTYSLKGRVGNPGENPPLISLPEDFQKVVHDSGGKVPPLLGVSFMKHWEAKTTKDLFASVRGTANAFFSINDEQTILAITAYILQSNGARPGPQELTMATAVEIRSLIVNSQVH